MNEYITFPELITKMKDGDIADCENDKWLSIIKVGGALFNYNTARNQMEDTLVVNDARIKHRYKIRLHLRFEPWSVAFIAMKDGHTIRGYDPEDIEGGYYELNHYSSFQELVDDHGSLDFALLFQLSWVIVDKKEEK
ncbi:hypothetical protein CPT_Mater32 [Bacillus phage Mater]|uniref:Uncharacterized protein n=1 Tax=Bacillus phage Mater TaxID=1540090 RepID=A0A0A0RNG8_9CAUD|nr:hypothetical protein CPT_Mater32 [Bacillus phage Mater]AIW03189.1 hypothetical protein CPT_Mater32 [Bacillus phage Mater]